MIEHLESVGCPRIFLLAARLIDTSHEVFIIDEAHEMPESQSLDHSQLL